MLVFCFFAVNRFRRMPSATIRFVVVCNRWVCTCLGMILYHWQSPLLNQRLDEENVNKGRQKCRRQIIKTEKSCQKWSLSLLVGRKNDKNVALLLGRRNSAAEAGTADSHRRLRNINSYLKNKLNYQNWLRQRRWC